MSSLWSGAGNILLSILNFFYSWTGSYGVAIVLLTFVVRLALHPLAQKQLKSMQEMQKIQPRLKTLQEKFGSDKQRLNQEMMQLYKEHKINPAAGCLPLVMQIPVMILLFNVLRTYQFADTHSMGIALVGSPISGLATALGVPFTGEPGVMAVVSALFSNPSGLSQVALYLPNLLLLFAITGLTWYQMRLSGNQNPQMAMMNTFMPIFMGFICLSIPGGVMIYWFTSSVWGLVQQVWVVRKGKQEAKEKPVLYKSRPDEGTPDKPEKLEVKQPERPTTRTSERKSATTAGSGGRTRHFTESFFDGEGNDKT